MEKLVRSLVEKGFLVATIKHDAHSFDADVPGRDSYRHRAAGAYGTAVFDKEKWMLIKDGEETIEGLIRPGVRSAAACPGDRPSAVHTGRSHGWAQ